MNEFSKIISILQSCIWRGNRTT